MRSGLTLIELAVGIIVVGVLGTLLLSGHPSVPVAQVPTPSPPPPSATVASATDESDGMVTLPSGLKYVDL
jgi:prepilin-type N-terminal cleavage/methylation domain-containing protein